MPLTGCAKPPAVNATARDCPSAFALQTRAERGTAGSVAGSDDDLASVAQDRARERRIDAERHVGNVDARGEKAQRDHAPGFRPEYEGRGAGCVRLRLHTVMIQKARRAIHVSQIAERFLLE